MKLKDALAHIDRLQEVTSEQDWDSYGAEPSKPILFEKAKGFVTAYPEHLYGIFPYAGGLSIEYKDDAFAVEVDIDEDGAFGYLLVVGRDDPQCPTYYKEGWAVPEVYIHMLLRTVLGHHFPPPTKEELGVDTSNDSVVQ